MNRINKNNISIPLTLPLIIIALLFSASACSNPSAVNTNADLKEFKDGQVSANKSAAITEKPDFDTKTVARFNEPWAMTALPAVNNESPVLLVTQKTGELFLVNTASGAKTKVNGIPTVAYGGQGGLGDITLAPDFSSSNNVYISYIEAGKEADSNKFGAKVIKATLTGLNTHAPSMQGIKSIWEQTPKVKGQGHYSHRLLFSPDGRYLFISSGERQKKDPAQDMSVNLGKIIRVHPDGSIPADNPFVTTIDKNANKNIVTQQLWTLGNRNVLGMAFDKTGKLWAHEMGPRGGDEFNLIEKGSNYGWPIVSNGRNYSGTDIPDHDTRPDFVAPKMTWTPVISPSSMSIYQSGTHNDFPAWQDNALISGLSSKALIVVAMDNEQATERYRYDMGERIRSVLAVDGKVLVLEDGDNAKLLELLPK